MAICTCGDTLPSHHYYCEAAKRVDSPGFSARGGQSEFCPRCGKGKRHSVTGHCSVCWASSVDERRAQEEAETARRMRGD